jgi:hypothetical protein
VRIVVLFPCWVRNFEVLDSQSRNVVHWNLKLHRTWADFFAALCSIRVFKADLYRNLMLKVALELTNGPDANLLLLFVLKCLA